MSDVSIFALCTNRNRRVLVLASEVAGAAGSEWIEPEHVLLGLVRDAAMGFPDARDEGEPLPLDEPVSVAAQTLEQLGIAVDDVAAAAAEAIGGLDAATPVPEGAQRVERLGRRGKAFIQLEVSAAREVEDNYISTGHQLVAVYSGWRSVPGRILSELGVPDRRRLREAVRDADTGRDRLRHEVAKLAAANPTLLDAVVALATGTTRPSRWMRRRVERRNAELASAAPS